MDKFLKAEIISNFKAGKNTVYEADEIDISQARVCVNANPRRKFGIQPRKGVAIDGSYSTDTTPITSAHTFTTKKGLERPIRSFSTYLEYRNPYLTTPDWLTLQDSFTDKAIFGYGDGDGFLYMCNGEEVIRRWSGACATFDLDNSDATHIALNAQGNYNTAAKLGFSATGEVILNGTTYTYSAIADLKLTVTVDPTGETDATGIAETPITSGFTNAPVGNILLIKDSRLFISGVEDNENAVYGSKAGNVRDYSFSTPAAADDGFVVKFWGKPITALGDKGEYVAVMKKDAGKKIGFVQLRSAAGDSILTVPKLDGLFEGEALGAVNMKGTIQSNLDFVFTSEEVGLRRITRIGDEQIDRPNSLTDEIEDEFDTYDLTDAVCGLLKQQIHLGLRSSNELSHNDLIILKDLRSGFIGDYRGINASAFFKLDGELYYGDSFTKNCWRMYTDDYSDFDGTNFLSYLFQWISKQLHYGYPEYLKELGYLYVEGYITPNTTAEIKLLFETADGSQTIAKEVVGTGDYVYKSTAKTLGIKKLGDKALAAGEDLDLPSGARKFRRMFTSTDLREINWFNMQYSIKTDQDGGFIRVTKLRPFVSVLAIDKVKNNSILNNV